MTRWGDKASLSCALLLLMAAFCVPAHAQDVTAAGIRRSDIHWEKFLVQKPAEYKDAVTLVFLFDPNVFGWQQEVNDARKIALRHRYDAFELWAVPTTAMQDEAKLEKAAIAWNLKCPVLPGATLGAYKPANTPVCLLFSHHGKLIKEGKAKEMALAAQKAVADAPHVILGADSSIYALLAQETQIVAKGDKLGRAVDQLQKAVAEESAGERGEQAAELLEQLTQFYQFHANRAALIKKYSPVDAVEYYEQLAQRFKGCALADACKAAVEEISDNDDYKYEQYGRMQSEEIRRGILATDLKKPILKKLVTLYEAARNVMIDFALTEADRSCAVYLEQLKTWLTTLAGLAEDGGNVVVITEDGQVIINGQGAGGGKGGGGYGGGGYGDGGGGK